MILHWWRNVDAENKMIFKRYCWLFVHSLCSIINASLLLYELLFKFTHYLFQSLQLILHASIDSWCSNALTRQLFYYLCQFSHLFSEHQLIVSTFIEFIEYLQLVQFLMYIFCLNWILLQDSNTHFSLTCWCHVNNAYHLFLMIRMKRKHHVNDILLSKEINVNLMLFNYIFYWFDLIDWIIIKESIKLTSISFNNKTSLIWCLHFILIIRDRWWALSMWYQWVNEKWVSLSCRRIQSRWRIFIRN